MDYDILNAILFHSLPPPNQPYYIYENICMSYAAQGRCFFHLVIKVRDWKEKHEKSLGEVIEIILSPQINKFKISTLISKNFVALPIEMKQLFMKFWNYGLYGIQSEKRGEHQSCKSEKFGSRFFRYGCLGLRLEIQDDHKMYKPEEYVLELVDNFLERLS